MTRLASDESVKKMIENWDKTYCHYCGKKISMLEASMTSDGQYFVCKNGECKK